VGKFRCDSGIIVRGNDRRNLGRNSLLEPWREMEQRSVSNARTCEDKSCNFRCKKMQASSMPLVRMSETPAQTYTRVTGKPWPGGRTEAIQNILKMLGIRDAPGTAEANLRLQKHLIDTYGAAPAPDEVATKIGNLAIECRRLKNSVEQWAEKTCLRFDESADWNKYRETLEKLDAALAEAIK
jgi:hypothetical protein